MFPSSPGQSVRVNIFQCRLISRLILQKYFWNRWVNTEKHLIIEYFLIFNGNNQDNEISRHEFQRWTNNYIEILFNFTSRDLYVYICGIRISVNCIKIPLKNIEIRWYFKSRLDDEGVISFIIRKKNYTYISLNVLFVSFFMLNM